MPIGNRPIKSKSESIDNDEYRQKFREKVFKLVKIGYDLLDSKEYKNSDEPDISGELVKKMRGITEDSTGSRWANFAIHDDPPINAPNRFGKNRRRLDIEIERTCRGPHPRYSFEAKRLSGNSFTAGKYFGGEGVMEFTLGHYAYDQNEAGMLGYVQSDNLEIWANNLQKQFERDKASIQAFPGEEWSQAKVTLPPKTVPVAIGVTA